jgi:APA family basic amino acid/polyamine antiporter
MANYSSDNLQGRPAFGLMALVALVVANMIGAGVFTTSGFALADLHSPNRVMLAWLVGGSVAMCGAIAYGALACEITESGGEYVFLSRLVHPAVGFLAGWVSLLAGFTSAIAFAAVTFEVYTFPSGSLPKGVVATITIVACALVHGWYKRSGIAGQSVMVAIKLFLLGGLLIWAASRYGTGPSRWLFSQPNEIPPFSWAVFARSLMWISLSYAGFNAAIYVAGEAAEASRAVPKSLWLGTALVTVFYLALNAVFVHAPALEQVIGQADVAVFAAEALGGKRLVFIVRGIIALALLTSVSSMILAGPRVYARMADDRVLPDRLRLRDGVPRGAIVLQSMLAIVVVWISSLQDLLSYLGFTLSLSSAGAVACVFVIHFRDNSRVSIVRRVAAVVYVVMTVFIAVFAAWRAPWPSVAGLGTLASGLLVYYLLEQKRRY